MQNSDTPTRADEALALLRAAGEAIVAAEEAMRALPDLDREEVIRRAIADREGSEDFLRAVHAEIQRRFPNVIPLPRNPGGRR